MTTTDIGILLIVLCILLWAIMAALHRHTVQLEALQKQLHELLEARQGDSGNAAAPSHSPAAHSPARRDDSETRTAPPSGESSLLRTRQTLSK